MSETIKFETNMPQVLALAFTEGKPVESQFTGSQVMFSTVDGRRMYLAPFVAEKIRAAGISARMPFEIGEVALAIRIAFALKSCGDASTIDTRYINLIRWIRNAIELDHLTVYDIAFAADVLDVS